MTISSTRSKLPDLAAGLAAGTLMFAATGSSHAVPQVGSVTVKSEEAIVHAVRAHNSGYNRLFRSPQTIKPAPSPRVRDHRGEPPKFVAPGSRCGYGRPGPCPIRLKKGNVRDHRSK